MSFKEMILQRIFGYGGGVRRADLSVKRYKFSDVLPYVSYDTEDRFYTLVDNCAGWVYECVPMIFAGGQMSSLANIFKQPFPEGTVIQTVLYADPYIEDILDRYKELRYANPELNEIFATQTERFADFFRAGAREGMQQLSQTPIRNFRLYVSVKVPISVKIEINPADYKKEVRKYRADLVDDLEKQLIQSGMSPKAMAPEDLLFVLSRIFNPDIEPKRPEWHDEIPLRKQIINGGTEIDVGASIKIGSMYARCITPKQFPKEIDSFLMNDMAGYFGKGAQSSDDDMNQIKCPFIFTSIFIYEKLNHYLDLRSSQVNIQRASGNLANGIVARREEMNWVMEQRERNGEVFGQVINVMWMFGRDDEVLKDRVNRVNSLWTNLNVTPQKELSFILPKLFVSALPLGMYNNDYKDLERHLTMPSLSAAHLMTIQAGCVGLGAPYMLFIDRRAQLVSLDILNTGANKNFLITGGTGGGKSFFLNYLVNCYRSVGARVRIIDVGKSYEKMANMFDGQFIHFAGSNIVLNFFEGIGDIDENIVIPENASLEERELLIRNRKEDYADKMFMLTGIVGTMASKTKEPATSEQVTLIETAIREVYKVKKNAMEIDDVINWLANIRVTDERHKRLAEVGYYLSLALQKYSSTGEYGFYFHGKSNVTFNNPLSVVELDNVPEDLRKVVVLAFASMIEDEVYNGDRKTATLVVLDEAWQTLSDNPAAAKFAEGLYRKIRKYNGSVGIATQAIADTAPDGKLGALGATIRGQSNMHFMLPDKSFPAAKRDGIVDFTEFEWNILVERLASKSLPRYSEMIVKSDKFAAAIRLLTDTFTYFVCSSDATDNIFLNYWRDRFMKEQNVTKMHGMVMAIDMAIEVCTQIGGLANFKHYVNTKFIPEINALEGAKL